MALNISRNNQQNDLVNNFGEYHDLVLEFLKKLSANSIELYNKKYQGRNITNTKELDMLKIKQAINYVADYLYYYYKFYKDDFYDIFMCLIRKLKCVTVLSPRERGIYGKYESIENCIYINPQMMSSPDLSSDNRIRLYVNHELGHIINERWMLFAEQYLNITPMSKQFNKQLIYDGFSLLDESTTQNRAEEITYYYLGRKRPSKKYQRSYMFNQHIYQTNYDYYGELQTPTITFARTLRGIGNITDDDLALKNLCARTLKYDFVTDLIDEYDRDGQLNNLYKLLQNLGIIKNASYAVFGMGEQKYLDQSLTALNNFSSLAGQLRDSRPPLPKRKR